MNKHLIRRLQRYNKLMSSYVARLIQSDEATTRELLAKIQELSMYIDTYSYKAYREIKNQPGS